MLVSNDEINRALSYHKIPHRWYAKLVAHHRTCDIICISRTTPKYIAYVSPVCDAIHIASLFHIPSQNRWNSLYSMQFDMDYLSAIIVHETFHLLLNRLGEYRASQAIDTLHEAWVEDKFGFMNVSYVLHAMLQ